MNIQVKDKSIPLFINPLDTEITVKNRIAWILNTLPEFMYLPENWEDEKEIVPIDLLEICTNPQNSASEIATKYKSYFEKEILVIVLNASKKLSDEFEIQTVEYLLDVDINYIITRNRHITWDFIQKEKRQFKILQNEILQFLQNLDKYPKFKINSYKIEEIQVKKKFQYHGDLDGLFNQLNATESFPLVLYDGYIKIFSSFKLSFNPQFGNYIRIHTKDGNDIIINRIQDFEFEIFAMTNEQDKYLEYINQILTSFKFLTNIENESDPLIKSSFVVVDKFINFPDLFSYLCNDKILSQFLSFNDQTSKKYTETSNALYYANPFDKQLAISSFITKQVATNLDEYGVQYGSEYLRFKINNAKSKEIQQFIYGIQKMMGRYIFEKRQVVQKLYSLVLNQTREKKVTEKKIKLQHVAPDVFDKAYTTACQPKGRRVIFVSDTKELEGVNSNRYMEFPKGSGMHYVCTDDKYPYPGLIPSSIGEYQLQPCCYKNDQTNSAFMKWHYQGIELEEKKDEKQAYLKKTHKITNFGQYAELSKDSAILKIQPQDQFFRVGTDITPHTFLQAVLIGMKKIEFSDNFQERVEQLVRERKRLLNNVFPEYLKQECWDMSLKEIHDYINSEIAFLDPRRVKRLLEKAYKCNILIFERNEQHPKSTVQLPYFVNNFLEYQRDNSLPTLIIYMHSGSLTETLLFPHCELLVLTEQTVSEFIKEPDYVAQIPQNKSAIYWSLYDMFAKSFTITQFQTSIPLLTNVNQQFIDSFGKVRYIQFNGYIIETEPLAPLNLTLIPNITKKYSVNEAFKFCQLYSDMNSVKREIIDDKIASLTGKLIDSGVQFKIHVQEEGDNMSQTFNKMVANVMINWFNYLFSNFIYEMNIEVIDANQIKQFIKLHTKKRENMDYQRISPFFIERETDVVEGNRLVYSSDQILRNLVYQLRLELEKNRDVIRDYRLRKQLRNYFTSVESFDKHDQEFIFYTEADKISSLLKTTKNRKIYNSIQKEKTEPYFMEYRGEIVLTQNQQTLKQALTVAYMWNKDRINVSRNVDDYNIQVENYVIDDGKRKNIPENVFVVLQKDEIFAPIMIL